MEIELNDNFYKKKTFRQLLLVILYVVTGFPKSLLFYMRYFGIKGFKMPILVSGKVKLKRMKGKVIITSDNWRFGMIKIGFPAPETYDNSNLSFVWLNVGTVIFEGKASIHNGSRFLNYGKIIIGNNFQVTATATIICYKKIKFGDNVLIGWDCEFMDGDAHKIYSLEDTSNTRINENREIIIGNNVWFGSDSKVLKGVEIGNDVIIASGSILTKKYPICNVIIGGSPAKILKHKIVWRI